MLDYCNNIKIKEKKYGKKYVRKGIKNIIKGRKGLGLERLEGI